MRVEVYNIADISKTKDLLKLYLFYTKNTDIFFDLEYLMVNSVHEDGDTKILFFYGDNDELLALFPFVKRKFENELYSFFDIITPYEYGGVLWLTDKREDKSFDQLLSKYCEEQNIITAFLRIDPFISETIDNKETLIKTRENIVIDLRMPMEDIFREFHKNNRRDIRYAERNGVIVKGRAPSKESIAIFYDLYKKAMDEKNAATYYFFNSEYFRKLAHLSAEKMTVYIAYNTEGIPISSALILKKGKYAHYHLSANDRAFTKLCANNILLYRAIEDLKFANHYCFFHLGGASKSQEGLYRFKKKFSKKTINYYIKKKIFNEYFYENIKKEIIENNLKSERKYDSDYFPFYRQ